MTISGQPNTTSCRKNVQEALQGIGRTSSWPTKGGGRGAPAAPTRYLGSVLEWRQLSTARTQRVPGRGRRTHLEVAAHVEQEDIEEVELLDALDQVAVLVDDINGGRGVVVRRRPEEVRRCDLLHEELAVGRVSSGVLVAAAAEGERGAGLSREIVEPEGVGRRDQRFVRRGVHRNAV